MYLSHWEMQLSKTLTFDWIPFFLCSVQTHKLKQIAELEKFNVKNQILKVQEKKLQQQLQQKKDLGKAEYEVENESVGRQDTAEWFN